MKIRILLADDKPERREWLKKLLEGKGYSVTIATDGMVALQLLTNHSKALWKFDLILTDTNMPCLSGPELVAELKLRKVRTPIIGMSNREESRTLYPNFWNKNEAYGILFSQISKLTVKSP